MYIFYIYIFHIYIYIYIYIYIWHLFFHNSPNGHYIICKWITGSLWANLPHRYTVLFLQGSPVRMLPPGIPVFIYNCNGPFFKIYLKCYSFHDEFPITLKSIKILPHLKHLFILIGHRWHYVILIFGLQAFLVYSASLIVNLAMSPQRLLGLGWPLSVNSPSYVSFNMITRIIYLKWINLVLSRRISSRDRAWQSYQGEVP